ncbi:methyl-accepting chemotaxis protein [Aeromonas schubertii]|uniref:Methyl-accepting chemotaxis protein n=1 Tax=Aeromonas schubertii TaxID=652 RepID=A0ABS7VFN6_9GAMM|nr:methyl-accepting chemotaxis protein [Aeromonas schubertii]KUE79147.1 chemotaxis protein [Aeromonas schubertii]MBZ6067773.1 methyl-accepting chemotaxis protein [Aeromonas schubertii]QCG48090.1 methyl-accepting chemotaxis protein [Aeromonas schubertii]
MKLNNLSILQRVYLGFAILILVMIGASSLTFFSQGQLKGALTRVTDQSMPLVQASARTQIVLLEAHRWLSDALSESDPKVLEEEISRLTREREATQAALAELKQAAASHPQLGAPLATLANQLEQYLSQTAPLPEKRRSMLERLTKVNRAKGQFQVTLPQFKKNLADMMITIDDSFIKMLAEKLTTQLSTIELSTMDALNQSATGAIEAALKRNKMQIQGFNATVKDLENELPDFDNDLGHQVRAFVRDTTAEEGLLVQYLALMREQAAMQAQRSAAGEQVVAVQQTLASVDRESRQIMDQSIAAADGVLSQSRITQGMAIAAAIVLALLVAWGLGKAIRRPLQELLSVLGAVTQGEMTARVRFQSHNEFGQLARQVNLLISQMGDVLGQLASAATQLTDTAHSNRHTAEKVRGELERQRAETASVATAMTQMEASVREVAMAAHQSLEQVQEVERASRIGRQVMAGNISTTHQLALKLQHAGQVIAEVSTMSNKIGNILEVIRGIAEQTNLLALNAAIEAARAGEQGRGFAVVADEVRNLASRTSDSTSEINAMIEGLQQAVSRAVKEMEECSGEMEASVQQSSDANGAMEEIQGIVTQINDMASQIAAAAEQQQATSAEIATNLNHISDISDLNYRGIDQVAGTSQQLDQLAERQQELVSRFRLIA